MTGAFRSDEPGGQTAKSAKAAQSSASSAADEASDPAGAGTWREVVDRTVGLGYDLTEAQIRRGREIAQQLSERLEGAGEPFGGDFRQVTDSVLRSFTDLTTGWLNLTTTLINLAAGNAQRGADPAAGNGHRESESSPKREVVAVELQSKRPVVVTVDLVPAAGRRVLGAHPLRAPEVGKAPLTRVSFAPAGDGNDLSVRIRVPDDQPAGIYSGAIYSLENGRAEGTLTLEIRDP